MNLYRLLHNRLSNDLVYLILWDYLGCQIPEIDVRILRRRMNFEFTYPMRFKINQEILAINKNDI
jgi:hypothetical protein